MHKVIVGTLGDQEFAREYAIPMFSFRRSVFHDRLQWDVSVSDGLEKDEYDDNDSIYIVVQNTTNASITGSWRLRPTTTPYMLRDTFGELLAGQAAPSDSRVWEISRFACVNTPYANPSYSFSATSLSLIQASVRLALERRIDRYVMVTSVGVERMLRQLGLRVGRFAPSRRIGRVRTVACWVDIDAHTQQVVLGHESDKIQEAA